MTAPTLPPLPEPEIIDRHIPTNIVIRGYKAAQMRAYALQAIEDWKKAQVQIAWIEHDMNCDDYDLDSVVCGDRPKIAWDGWEWVPLYALEQP
jgi:hypothetical protein